MFVRFSSPLLRLCAMGIVLAMPIFATVVVRVHDANGAVASIEDEARGLRCAIRASDLLAAVERHRLAVTAKSYAHRKLSRDALRAALAHLDVPDCRALIAGPRRPVKVVAAHARAMLALPSLTLAAPATVTLADDILALLLDIGDASGLTYDPTVDAVNLDDALVARVPGRTERLDQSAEILALAQRAGAITGAVIGAVEKHSGQAFEIDAMANDDFDGAAIGIPSIGPALRAARGRTDHAQSALAREIDRDVRPNVSAGMDARLPQLREASIDAGQQLMRAAARILMQSFERRMTMLRQGIGITLGGGVLAMLVAGAVVAGLWHAMRRRDRAELERAHERAQILETMLARRNAEAALRLTEQQFRAVFNGSNVGIAIVEGHSGRFDANPALCAMFDDDLALVASQAKVLLEQMLRGAQDTRHVELCFARPAGPPIWVDLSLSLVSAATDDAASAMLLVHDITEHKLLNAQLDHETLHDALTALPNRIHFIRHVTALVEAGHEQFAVVFVDLDHFKLVNDTLGHHAGDATLRRAARQLVDALRPTDFAARLHGDEFAVVVRGADHEHVDTVVARIRTALNFAVETGPNAIQISASIGFVRDGASYADPETLLRDADAAMYRSKSSGRDRATAHDPTHLPAA
jgi:diguanylate cyclase (GGDEF)-like protein